MAEVYKAKSFGVEGFEKVLVIKRILPELAKREDFVDMFIHEAKLAVRLSHANIVQVFDLGRAADEEHSADAYFMAMEYVQGLDLASLLAGCRRQQQALPIDLCLFIAGEVAKGLDHAHRRRDEQLRPLGIVHRDVSPQNVLVSFEGEVKVTDFGIAKARGVLDAGDVEDTQTRRLHGKFGYMSPEQARGDEVDARSDIFSLGVVLYECIAGVNPFAAPTAIETLRRVQACEIPPVEILRPDVGPELVTLLGQALAKEPEKRFADAGRMYEAILALLYTSGSRFGAHDLAEFLESYRSPLEQSGMTVLPDRLLDDEAAITAERTPVETPASRGMSTGRFPIAGDRVIHIDRAAELGERREITALVADLGSRPEGDRSQRIKTILSRYGARVLSDEDGKIVALFGLGEPDGRDTEMATRCALVARRVVGGSGPLGVGVHAARIHIGNSGEPTQDERLTGLVATATELARVRTDACAISRTAMRQLKGLFDFELFSEAGERTTHVDGAFVRGVSREEQRQTGFVGRRVAIRRCGEVIRDAQHAPKALTIRGAQGIGKSRFIAEVGRRLSKGKFDVGFYVAQCPPRGREYPLSGVAAMLQQLCGVGEGDPPDRVLAVEPRLRALGLHDKEVAAVLTALGATVPASNENTKAALRRAFCQMVSSLGNDRLNTFIWDEAHWLDEDSIDILLSALDSLKRSRFVVAFAARAGFAHAIESHPAHTALDLGELEHDDIDRLVAARLGVDIVPAELSRFIRERAGGHPQFVEEIVKVLVETRAVTVVDRSVLNMRLVGQELALPKTLRGLVGSRISRLSPEERTTLQAAAVLGEPIDLSVLAEMLDQDVSTTGRYVAELVSRELLTHTGPTELKFTSPVVREVVQDALTPEASREMHAAAASALEHLVNENAPERAARIAAHLYEAGDRDRAATHFALSGERRMDARQLELAARDFSRAIELSNVGTRPPEELAEWLRELSQAARIVRAVPEAAEMCDRVIGRIDAGEGSKEVRVRARVDAGVMLAALGRFDLARQLFGEAEDIAMGDMTLATQVLLAYAELSSRQGDFNRALAMLDRLEAIMAEDTDPVEEHKMIRYRAQAYAGMGNRSEALRELDRAEALLPDDVAAASERQKVRGIVDYLTGDFAGAVLACEKAADLARQLGYTYEVCVNLHNLGDALVHLGDLPRAYGAIQQSYDLCLEGGFDRLASQNRMFLSFLNGAAGDDGAVTRLKKGIEFAEAHDYTWDALNGRALLAELLKRRGELEAARREFLRNAAAARECGNRLVAEESERALRELSEMGS